MKVKQFMGRNLLLIAMLVLPTSAYSQDPELSCSGIQEKWFLSIDPILEAFEYVINEKIDQYVSIADFNVGDEDFGAMGTGDLGHLNIPKFDKKTPKQYLKSAVQDLGLTPSYTIDATILGSTMQVVRVQLSGGQGCKTKEGACSTTPANGQSGKDRLSIDVKVAGMTVLSDENDPPETEALAIDEQLTPAQMASRLPGKEKKGTGGELMDIKRGFNGNQQLARIPIYDVIYITVDAGYVLHAGLIFTYGVESSGYRIGGSTSYAMNMNSFAPKPKPAGGVANPALSPQDYQSCAFQSNSCTNQSSIPVWSKSEQFWNSMNTAAGQNVIDSFSDVRDALRDIHVKETYRDAKLTKVLFKENLDKVLHDPNITSEEKYKLMQEMDLGPIKKDLKKIQRLVNNVNYSAETLISAYNMVEQSINTISDGKFPEVTAAAGVSLDGQAKVWANASVEVNLMSVVRAWAGIEGSLTILDAAMGIGASVSSQSQYLDVTGKMDYEVLAGDISIIWGYTILNFITDTGTLDLFHFPGKTRTNNGLIARIDFDPPNGMDVFFWCADIFGNSASLDTERCKNGNVALRKLNDGLAAHDEYQQFVLDETPIGKENKCVITTEGKFVYSSDDSSSTCNNYLPNSGGILSNSTSNEPHPLARAFLNDPQLFLTYLRNDSNQPMMYLSALKPLSPRLTKTYTAAQPVGFDPQTTGQIVPLPYFPTAQGLTTASIEDRLFTITSHGVLHDVSKDPSNTVDPEFETLVADASDASTTTNPQFLVQLASFANGSGGTYASNSSIFVGHLVALHNDTLIDLAEDYRLGQCRISTINTTSGPVRRLMLNERVYPVEGVANGSTTANAAIPRLGCDLGTDAPSNSEVRSWEACMLRSALVRKECYPPQRITSLIEVDNLSDQEILKYFNQPNKRITGELDFGPAQTETLTPYYGTPYNTHPANGSRLGLEVTNLGTPPPSNLANEAIWHMNRSVPDSLASKSSPNGNCEGFGKTYNGNNWLSTPFVPTYVSNGTSPYMNLPQQFFHIEDDPPLYTPGYGGMQYIVINEHYCVDPSFLGGSFNLNPYLDYTNSFGGGMSENSPHQVVIMCVEDNMWSNVANAYIGYGPRTWKGYIRSAILKKPYAISSNNQTYALDEGAFNIVETYNELPPASGNGHVLDGSLCNTNYNKNIIHFPRGPAYAGNKIQQMLSGSLHSDKMSKAIRLCVKNNDCEYVPLSQKKDLTPVCNVEANIGGSIVKTVTTNSSGKNLNACLSTNLEFSSAENFCRKYESDIMGPNGNNIPNIGVTTVNVTGKWQQSVDVGTVLAHTVSDPVTGRHAIGKCVYEKNAAGDIKLLGAANQSNNVNQSGDCELRATLSGGSSLVIGQQTVANFKGNITADVCKSRFGYRSGTLSGLDAIQTSTLCSSITGSQLLRLRDMGILPNSGDGTFQLQTAVTVPGSPNNGQTASVGSCTFLEEDITKLINEQTKCTLQMWTLNGYHAAPIDIYLPPPATGVSRMQQCQEARLRYHSSYGNPPICSPELRKTSQYAALNAISGAGISFQLVLGDTPTSSTPMSCKGEPINDTHPINPAEYNQDCIADLKATNSNAGITPIVLTPAERMWSIDANKWLSTDPSSGLPLDKCKNYWSNQMVKYDPKGNLSNYHFCQSIHEDVKNYLTVIQPNIPAPNGNGKWSTQPASGTITTVTGFGKVFAPGPPCNNCAMDRTAATSAGSPTAKTSNTGSSKTVISVNGSQSKLEPTGPGGGGSGGTGTPVWQTSSAITQCSYEFKRNDKTGEWDLMDHNWENRDLPTSNTGSTVRERRCIKDLNNQCTDYNAGDLLIFAGSGGRAVKKYSSTQLPSPLDQEFVDQFCDANYNRLVPLSDNLYSDPEKRLPVWLRFVDAQGNVNVPTVTEVAPYYCKPKKCELWVGFGTDYYQPTESEWKDNLSAMPTSASSCRTFYQGQVAAYCAKTLLLPQMPDNMDITLSAVFDKTTARVGVCPATQTHRTCNIGQRKPDSWLSWLTGTNFSTVETVENFSKALLLPLRSTGRDLILANFFPNTLAACVESAREMNYGNQLCSRAADGINHNQPYEIAVQFGDFTQTVASCSGTILNSQNPTPQVAERPLSATIKPTNKCAYEINFDNYVENATIQIAACPHRNCNPEELSVIYAAKPEQTDRKTTLNLNEILPTTWSKTARGSGSIYINQADRFGNIGEWVQLSPDAYAAYGTELTNSCNIAVTDLSAKIVGDVCEKTYLEFDGYEAGSMIEIGACPYSAGKCTQKDFEVIFKSDDIQQNQIDFLPVIETAWPKVGKDGTVGVRQQYVDGKSGAWTPILQQDFITAATNAINECGVKP